MEDIRKRYLEEMDKEKKQKISENRELIEKFQTYCLKFGIVLKEENFDYIETIGITANYPNIITHLNSNINNDKEGLIDFDLLKSIYKKENFITGYLYSDNYMIMANTLFRRGFSPYSNFSPSFIDLFWNSNFDNTKPFISIDLNRVRINVNKSKFIELDFWQGAKFSNEIQNIKDGNVQLRPPMEFTAMDISFFFNDAYSLDIKWSTKDDIKTFQAEEFKTNNITINNDGIDYYPVRYIHAEYDLKNEYFRHFDGAIHFYTEFEYYQRRDSDFNYNSKNEFKIKTLSQKLFKINGELDTKDWIQYTSHFFTKNPLVVEYFEGKYPDHINSMIERLKNDEESTSK